MMTIAVSAAVQSSANTSGLFVTTITLILVIIAVKRSPTAWRTLLYLVGVMFLAGAVGAAIGWTSSPAAAGSLAGLGVQLGGIAASIERILQFRKDARAKTSKP